jgi:hypothetical protein
MELSKVSAPSVSAVEPITLQSGGQPTHARSRAHSRRAHQRTPKLYRLCDGLTEGLLYGMIVFSPWAFGTTQGRAIWTMTVAGCALGGLLVAKWIIRWRTGYEPSRWGSGKPRWLVVSLAVLTVLILGWCLLSAVNARATFDQKQLGFEYHDRYIPWLPHSYDARSTWFVFWQYLGLAWVFWAVRDWLLGKTRRERHAEWAAEEGEGGGVPRTPGEHGGETPGRLPPRLPARLRRLLWVLCLNGALLAAEGIFQRMDGTNKLLWLVEPWMNKTAKSQFGPYAYRANGAQYLNLIWPVCLGFWWTLRQEARRTVRAGARMGASPHVLLLPCALVIAAGPFISSSRGGAAVAGMMLVVACILLLLAGRRERLRSKLAPLLFVACVLGVGAYLGWEELRNRFVGSVVSYPLRLPVALREFTLRCVFEVPRWSPQEFTTIVGLANAKSDWVTSPGTAWIAIVMWPKASLEARIYGPESTRYRSVQLTGYPAEHPGEVVELAMVKGTNLSLFLEGRLVDGKDMSSGGFSLLADVPGVDYLFARKELVSKAGAVLPVHAVTVFDRALSAAEIEAIEAVAAHARQAGQGGPGAPDLGPWRPVVDLDFTQPRTSLLADGMGGRFDVYRIAHRMAEDFAWLGSGPGTFGPLYYLYRSDSLETWQACAHDDWLETRVTFGWTGFALVLLALVVAVGAGFCPGGTPVGWPLAALVGLAMAGCLIHAKFDFPLQVHSILLLFLLMTSVFSFGTPHWTDRRSAAL